MDVIVINDCMKYFIGLLNTFLSSSFGHYLCGCLVALICFNLFLSLADLKK